MRHQSTSENELTYHVRIHDEGDDGLWAEVVELPGCFASGEDMEELEEALTEAISQYLSAPGSPISLQLNRREPISGERVEEQKYLVCG
ncbi:type II toxin-antitoxin system HicB family antitoxin [Streptomyces sp. NPDC088817]|uniref:type II toxin-antitoxin system HicB family antitoxin n=1 Tax=Streptomyces sp. NPDC088817 TaxID=3365907 RepID=UPI0037F60B1F